MSNALIDWLISSALFDWLIDWLVDFIYFIRSIDWLIDWFHWLYLFDRLIGWLVDFWQRKLLRWSTETSPTMCPFSRSKCRSWTRPLRSWRKRRRIAWRVPPIFGINTRKSAPLWEFRQVLWTYLFPVFPQIPCPKNGISSSSSSFVIGTKCAGRTAGRSWCPSEVVR